jgi:DNA processing protein
MGICGSRNASSRGLEYARAFGQAVAGRKLQVVSGYARGVDLESHIGALEVGGHTVIVLAEGIKHFKVKRAVRSLPFNESNVLVVSQFAPTQTWAAGAAMIRNGLIAGLSDGMLVVEARSSGGTLDAGIRALKMGRPVYTIVYSEDVPEGNTLLVQHGAIPVRTPGRVVLGAGLGCGWGPPHGAA